MSRRRKRTTAARAGETRGRERGLIVVCRASKKPANQPTVPDLQILGAWVYMGTWVPGHLGTWTPKRPRTVFRQCVRFVSLAQPWGELQL